MIGAGADGSGPTAGAGCSYGARLQTTWTTCFGFTAMSSPTLTTRRVRTTATPVAAGLVRRPDLEIEDDAGRVVILVTRWPTE
jgi:hypothetical protein